MEVSGDVPGREGESVDEEGAAAIGLDKLRMMSAALVGTAAPTQHCGHWCWLCKSKAHLQVMVALPPMQSAPTTVDLACGALALTVWSSSAHRLAPWPAGGTHQRRPCPAAPWPPRPDPLLCVASWPHQICICIPRERTGNTGGEGGCGAPSGAGEIEGGDSGREQGGRGRWRGGGEQARGGGGGGEASGLGYGARGCRW
jgi:hypothetical protein